MTEALPRTWQLAIGYWSLVIAFGVLAGACAEGPIPRYKGPAGVGPVIYVPEVGITRKGADLTIRTSTDEQAHFAQEQAAFEERRWAEVIALSLGHSDAWPEGSRVVEAILLRIRARLALGRDRDPEIGLAQSIALEHWLFLYLAPIHDARLQDLMRRDEATRATVSEFRALSLNDFVTRLQADADALYNSGQLHLALADCRTLLTYYLPALEVQRMRTEAAELTRDVAWLLYAARDFSSVIEASLDLLAMNPAPALKADALFIQGHAQRRNGAHAIAANTFSLLFSGAGLRDTDTRWRAHALMWQINETMAASKGPGYDLVPYERALELLGEYELYAIENPNIDPALHDEFIALLERVYDIMIERDLTAADTYSRLGQARAEQYYIDSAAEWQARRDSRVAELRRGQ